MTTQVQPGLQNKTNIRKKKERKSEQEACSQMSRSTHASQIKAADSFVSGVYTACLVFSGLISCSRSRKTSMFAIRIHLRSDWRCREHLCLIPGSQPHFQCGVHAWLQVSGMCRCDLSTGFGVLPLLSKALLFLFALLALSSLTWVLWTESRHIQGELMFSCTVVTRKNSFSDLHIHTNTCKLFFYDCLYPCSLLSLDARRL